MRRCWGACDHQACLTADYQERTFTFTNTFATKIVFGIIYVTFLFFAETAEKFKMG